MRVLIAGYSAENHSSYGLITRHTWRRLQMMNPSWVIMQHGWFHKSLEPVTWAIEPTAQVMDNQGTVGHHRGDIYGKLTFAKVVQQFKPDLVWTLSDPYMCDYMGGLRPQYGFKLIKHCPVDGVPQPSSWRDAIKDCDAFVPVTRFGAQALAPWFDGEVKQHIYHGVDTDVFRPFPPKEKESIRPKGLGDDAVIMGFVGHNQFRKMNFLMYPLLKYLKDGAYWHCEACGRVTLDEWDAVKRAFLITKHSCDFCPEFAGAPGRRGRSRNVYLWMHTFSRGQVHWLPEKHKLHWGVDDRVLFSQEMQADQGIPDNEMPKLYNACDFTLSLSGGEGFCLPVVESMACGTPVVYTDYSGQAEIAYGSGLPVKVAAFIPDQGEPINRAIADLGSAVQQCLRMMDDKKYYEHMSQNGIRAAREVFSWDMVASQWDALIKKTIKPRNTKAIGVSV